MKGQPKYEPLEEHLQTQPATTNAFTMSFEEVEEVLSSPLPVSAYRYLAWWLDHSIDTTHVQSHAWMKAGWSVAAEDLDLAGKRVTFRRDLRSDS